MSACRYRILVVDDDPALLRLLSMRLSAAGYEVAAVESGEKALFCYKFPFGTTFFFFFLHWDFSFSCAIKPFMSAILWLF